MINFTQKFQHFFILTWIVIMGFPFYGVAQNPGGVLGQAVWYKANTGITLSATKVTQWTDFSGNDNHAIQSTATSQPAYTANSINFNQAVTFSGSNYLTAPINDLPSGNDSRSVFVVATAADAQVGSGWIYGYGGGPGNAFNIGKSANISALYASGFSDDAQSSNGFWVNNVPKLGTITYSSPTVSFFDASSPFGTSTKAWNTVLTPSSARIGAFVNSSTEFWNGNIAEIIVYPSAITGSAAASIETYLSIKYGIHKADGYRNSMGVMVWNITNNAAYNNDVFGIAQDDASGLLQPQSNSTNTGSGDGTGQSGKGNIIISSPSALVNNRFLMIGHNATALAEADVIVAGNLTKRVQRNWKVQATGTLGTVTLSYDISGLNYFGQIASDYTLLVDPTGSGDFTGGSVVKYPAAGLSGTKVSFNTVALPTGAVFTFQTISVPTIQASNLVFTNTTTTTTTASWTIGNGTERAVFIYAGANGSALPLNYTTYTANAALGSGTQIGTSGWYCIYKGTGTTVDITGLTPGTTYQVMTIEYNGTTAGKEVYQTAIATGNPAAVTTISNIATLSNLTLSSGPLGPVFASATIEYTATVENAISSVTLTPVLTQANATITINGVTVASGSAFEINNLLVGPNVVTIEVMAQDGITKKTYTTTITRLPSTDASLINLLLSEGSLDPSFTTNEIEYSAVVKNNISTITVTPVSTDANATITINDAIVASGKASDTIDLIIGQTTITTAVMAQDGVTIKTYTITITRLASSDASLSDLSITDGDLKPSFSGDKTDYNVTVENAIDTFTVTPIANDANATMTINGVPVDNTASGTTIPLNVGDNTITIVVTAPDGTTIQTYTIHVYREGAQVVATNVITPNGDGINDFWVVKNLNAYPNNSVKVFDRAGRVVYSKNNYNNDWDGSYNGSPLSGNTYYYLINLGSNLPKIKGFITIIRD
jgi:gliding motility-associated-like protein